MKDIKFRAFSKKLNRMLTSKTIKQSSDSLVEIINKVMPGLDCKKGVFIPTEDTELEIMQYTGLKDKNGTEIYEGDIVRQTYHKVIEFGDEVESFEGCHVGEVVIVSSGVCLRNPLIYDTDTGKTKSKGYKNIASYRCEVIGNIYENPELRRNIDGTSKS